MKFRLIPIGGVIALTLLTACPSMMRRSVPSATDKRVVTSSQETSAVQGAGSRPASQLKSSPSSRSRSFVTGAQRARVCSILREYPKPPGEKLAFELGRIGGLCEPFVRGTRATLDRCGEVGADPYTIVTKTKPAVAPTRTTPLASTKTEVALSSDSAAEPAGGGTAVRSDATWPTRNQMYSKGKINLLADEEAKVHLPRLYSRIERIREEASQLCCGDDLRCQMAMNRVEVSICQPQSDPNASDPCVFGGTFEMAGRNYARIFGGLSRMYSSNDTMELGAIASRNVASMSLGGAGGEYDPEEFSPVGGRIVLTSYVSKRDGASALEPTLHHEFGHACSMIRMQTAAASGANPESRGKALRAIRWLDQVKRRCDIGAELPEAYTDFWETMGESRELASCLFRLTDLNRKGEIDRPCEGICPGHYLEEAVGVAFSLLNGDVSGLAESVYPNTCDHMRDRQHPMVADITECLAQHSPRFRARISQAYSCGDTIVSAVPEPQATY